MAIKHSRAILGIELDEQEIRIVELRNRNGEASISALTAYSPDPGYLDEWGIKDPEGIGAQLKSLMHGAEIKATDVAFGLPSWCISLRALGVPPVGGNELFFIADGEIEHVQMFREPGASFDLVRLNDSKLLESSGRNFLLIGAEHSVLDSLKQMAKAAGLHVVAAEPTHSALYRIAYSQATTPPNLFVTLSETHAEISLLDRGQLALHRTFDLGASIFDTPEAEEGGFKPYFDIDAASSLAVELRRSIDFIARELPDAPPTETLHLACTHPEAPVLAHWLESALSVDVQVADIRRGGPQLRILKALTENDSNRYVAAYGLALRDPAFLPATVPVVNLYAYDLIRSGVRDDGRRKFQLALAGSCVLMACGILTAVMGTIRAHQAADALLKSTAKLSATKAIESAKANEVAHRAVRMALLESDGVPVRPLMSSIVKAVPPEVGLVGVTMNPQFSEINGETVSESAIIRMSELLRSDPAFTSVSLSSFEQVNAANPKAGMRFRMLMQSPPPVVPPTPPPTATASLDPSLMTTKPTRGQS